MMKKLTAIFLGIALSASLAACGSTAGSSITAAPAESSISSAASAGGETVSDTADTSQTAASVAGEASSTASEASAQLTSGKTLVVYYSATGNTKTVARYIADVTGGDLFELEPVEPYTDEDLNYNDPDSRVCREHDDESLREVELVSTTVDNFSDYNEIFVGYPIWWGVSAWPVNQFIKNNDFTGKTVIPFCTSASSGIGDSGKLLEEMAGTGDWLAGERFSSNVSEDDVRTWLDSLE